MLNGVPIIYDMDASLAAFYDHTQTEARDVALIRRLLAERGPLRILEACCGTGRILIPLAQDGHEIVGIDCSQTMLDRARATLAKLPEAVRQRVRLMQADVTSGPWPGGFDVVLLAGNCLYEMATPAEQEACVRFAAAALKPAGHLLLDNDHMEGELDESWCRVGAVEKAYPTGVCPDGTKVEGTSQCLWFDRPRRLARSRRQVTVRFPDGSELSRQWEQQKHPPSVLEMKSWLDAAGLVVEQFYGDHKPTPYTDASSRAIFWAMKPSSS